MLSLKFLVCAYSKKTFFDGIFTIVRAKKNPYFNLVEPNRFGYLKLSKNTSNSIVRRQDAPKVFEHVANTYVLKPNFISKTRSFMTGNFFGYTVKEKFSWDIDNNFDFEVAEYLLRKNK